MTTLRSHTRLITRAAVALTSVVVASACGSSPTGPSQPCTFSLSSPSQSFSSDGGPGAVTVATGASCSWTVLGASEWVTLVSPTAVTGPGTVTFTVDRNGSDAAREKTLTIAAAAFTVRQDGLTPCSFSIDPERRELTSSGGSAQVSVTTTAGCAWTAASQVPWVTITAGATGRGSAAVTYSVAENNTTTARTGTLLVAGRTHTIAQRGEDAAPLACEYRVTPVDFAPCMARGTLTATITTQASCTWTTASDAPWLTVVGGRSGTGSGTITLAYADNYLAPRRGVAMVRWPTPSLGQNIHVAQAGCLYGVSRSAIDIGSSAGTGSFDVLQESDPNTCGGPLQDRCVWTARSDASWLVVATGMPQTGDHPVSFTVSANTGTARIGHITIADQRVTVTQAAP